MTPTQQMIERTRMVYCPVCKAPPRSPCLTTSKAPAKADHVSRLKLSKGVQ